jgi:plasmid stability protein
LKNITITLDDQAAAWARVQAAEHNMSLSRFVGELLRNKMRHSREYERAMRAALAEKPLRLEGAYLKRDELYDRPRLR